MGDLIVGSFSSWDEAHAAVGNLKASGFPAEAVSVVAAHPDSAAREAEEKSEEDAGLLGAAAGGAMGAAGGFAVGLTALAVPGVGPVLAAGPILGALAGLMAGAGAGGLLGAFLGAGVPHPEAAACEAAVRRGQVVVGVASGAREDDARRILLGAGATETHLEHESAAHGGQAPAASDAPGHDRDAVAVTPGPVAAPPAPVDPAEAMEAVQEMETVGVGGGSASKACRPPGGTP